MAQLYAAIKQSGPPTKDTPGSVGQDYVDTTTGLRWECVEALSEKTYKGLKTSYIWELRGLDPEFVVDGLSSGGSGGSSLPVKLDILETIVDYENLSGSNRKFTFPSEITLHDGELYLLIYKYFYNGFGSLDNHITAVSQVVDGKVYWGHSDPENCVMMDKTGITDNWLATDDDTTESNFKVYKVQKTITDEPAYHAMNLEGYNCLAPGIHAHAEGCTTVASGMYSHAEGTNAEAIGQHSHAEGFNTKAASGGQHVEGKYNAIDEYGKYAHIVGNGTDESNRSNAYTLDWEGNAWFAGDVHTKAGQLATAPSALQITINKSNWDSSTKSITVDIYSEFLNSFDSLSDYTFMVMPTFLNCREYYTYGIKTTDISIRESVEMDTEAISRAGSITFACDTVPTAYMAVWLVAIRLNRYRRS